MMTATVVASANTDASYGVETIARGGQCARCRTGLGRIINRGAACRVCMQRVCKSCREYERSSATHWLCTSCHRSQDINSKFWLTELVERTSNKLQCSIKNSIQRSLTFSESSPSPWSALRGSPELRAYSSMPRHHDNASVDSAASRLHDNAAARHHDNASVDTAAPHRRPRPFPRRHHRLEKGNDAGLETACDQTDFKVVDTCGTVLDLPCLHPALTGPAEGEGQTSPTLKPRAPPSPTSAALASLRRKMVDLKQLPPGVTPPRSRRLFLNGCRLEDPLLQDPSYSPIYDPGTGRVFIPDGEDYKLVFLSSSESSSREDQSDDASSTCSGVIGLMDDADWDYFENSAKTIPVLTDFHRKTQKSILVPIERESQEERGSSEVEGSARGASSPVSHAEYLGPVASYVPLPIPVPIPVPIFVPVPCNNPELTIRVEHYLSPNFWSNFLATNGNLANVFANNRLSNGNDEIFGHDTGSSRTNASMETSRVITPSDRETSREINDSETNREEVNVVSVSRESEPMLLKNKKSFEVSVLNESVTSEPMLLKNNKSIPDVPQDPAVTLQTYRRLEEDGCGKAAPLHPDEDPFSSLSDSSDSSSARSPVKRKYRFNRGDLAEENISSSDSSDCSSDEEDAKQTTASVKKDISLSTILNFDNSLRVDAGDKNEKETNVPRIEVSKRCDLKTNSFSNQSLASCDNSVSHVSQESKLDLSDIRSVDAADLRSSDEFSGTESMELVPHEDEQGHVTSLGASESCKEQSSGPFTSLVMITDHVTTENESERDSPVHVNVVTNDTTTFVPSKDKEKFKLTLNTSDSAGEKESDSSGNLELAVQSEEDQVRVVTGGNTMSAVVCLEEGLADDDSWVEELDREEMPITDSSEGEQEFPDREEELRGYHRTAIDYSLFTIIEESCEESEVEEKSRPTQLENYFLRALGGADTISLRIDDTVSETSSVFSEDVESADNLEPEEKPFKSEIGTSRLEQYFLTELVGFSRRDSDGSVGSDSEGRPSPEQRRKRLVRARGTGRHYSSSLDNLTESEQQVEMQLESENSSSETDSRDESSLFEKNDGQFDTVKRTKKKKRSVTSAPSLEMLDVPEEHSLNDEPREEANSENEKADEMELIHQSDRNKHQSRDSGFMGSSDDLIKETKTVEPDVSLTEEVEEEVAEPEAKPEKQSEETASVIPPEPTPPVTAPPTTPTITLSRKDSFNNWSSDEETNLMMSKMKAFFKTMVANQPKPSSPTMKPRVHKPPQLIHFENELTRLMKTVPGLREEQVREIVEYLSSEDTWSDSYDSSDYTSSDLEQTRDSALVYQRLLASFHKVDKASLPHNSPPLIAKVMQHIGGRLVALMHEVSSGESAASPRLARHHRRLQPKLSNISTTTEEEEEGLDFTPLPRSKSHDPLLEEARQEASDNERFSWRGSFESALMVSDSRGRLASGGEMSTSASALAIAHAKRRSAGDLLFQSREQLDRVRSCGSIGGSVEKMWPLRTHGSVPDSGGSADGEEESEEDAGGGRSTLPRSLQSSCAAGTHSLPRLPTSGASPSIYKTHAGVKSARYRPPGYSRAGAAPPPRRDTRRRAQLTPPPLAAHLNATSLGSPEDLLGSPESQYNKSAPSILVEDEVPEKISQHNKSLLGARSDSMASVYSGAGEGRYGSVTVKGEVEFGLQYNYKQGALEIHVKQCKELAPVDAKRMRSDPYVKVYLLPDKSKAGKRKTRVKKHTLSPVFDEVLKFHLTLEDLESRTLWLSVWHSDMFGRNDFLGEVMMPLEHKVFDDPAPKSYVLQERSEILDELICSKGELIIGLKFVPAATEGAASKKSAAQAATGSLHVLIKEAKSLCPVKSNSSLDAFCKAYLLPDKGRKHKTGIVKRSTSPQWNHTVVYKDVTLDELSERCLELTVWDHDRLTSNEFLGGIRLNLGHGKHYSKLVDWMDSSGKEILLWQQMMERPNFWVESCIALRPSLDLRNN